MFDPNAHLPQINKGMIYLGACLIAGIRLARQTQVRFTLILDAAGTINRHRNVMAEAAETRACNRRMKELAAEDQGEAWWTALQSDWILLR